VSELVADDDPPLRVDVDARRVVQSGVRALDDAQGRGDPVGVGSETVD